MCTRKKMQLFRKLTPLFGGKFCMLYGCISHRKFLITFWFGSYRGSDAGLWMMVRLFLLLTFVAFSTACQPACSLVLVKDCNYPLFYKLKLKSLVYSLALWHIAHNVCVISIFEIWRLCRSLCLLLIFHKFLIGSFRFFYCEFLRFWLGFWWNEIELIWEGGGICTVLGWQQSNSIILK